MDVWLVTSAFVVPFLLQSRHCCHRDRSHICRGSLRLGESPDLSRTCRPPVLQLWLDAAPAGEMRRQRPLLASRKPRHVNLGIWGLESEPVSGAHHCWLIIFHGLPSELGLVSMSDGTGRLLLERHSIPTNTCKQYLEQLLYMYGLLSGSLGQSGIGMRADAGGGLPLFIGWKACIRVSWREIRSAPIYARYDMISDNLNRLCYCSTYRLTRHTEVVVCWCYSWSFAYRTCNLK